MVQVVDGGELLGGERRIGRTEDALGAGIEEREVTGNVRHGDELGHGLDGGAPARALLLGGAEQPGVLEGDAELGGQRGDGGSVLTGEAVARAPDGEYAGGATGTEDGGE